MSKINCLIVDDEPIAQRIIASYLKELEDFHLVTTCKNALEANKVLNQEAVDLMFLDIEMPKLKGLAFLKSLSNPPKVIITTAYREYALEGFELDVLDYLLKPISFERFFKAVNKFKAIHTKTTDTKPTPAKIIHLKSDRKMLRINEAEIRYIEGMNNYVLVHVEGQKFPVYISLTEIQSKLGDQFVRIHKSFIINKDYLAAFTKEYVEIGGKEIPIGKSYKEVVDGF